MEDQIRSALASKDYALAQTLADDWLSREPHLLTAHYFAAWSRDAQGLESDALIHYEKAFELVKLSARIHLDRPVPLRLLFFRASRYFRGLIAADPGIDLHSISDSATQHLVHAQTVPFAFQIPERLIDSRQRAHQHRST
ncbi:MAG TPA: hypothetical protein VK673_00035, partial [Chthoniobacterales bacterium]|nr:hypothetical protein [Chthoniobacterales bacterium]